MDQRRQNYILVGAGVLCLIVAAVLLHSFKGQFGRDTKGVSSVVPAMEETIDVSKPTKEASSAPQQVTSTASLPSKWVVYVTGAVKKPGVYEVPCDSRVYAALNAAGGFSDKAEPEAVNLAAMLQDGVQIHFPKKGENAAAPSVPRTSSTPSQTQSQTSAIVNQTPVVGNLVNINTAAQSELETLTGIGPKTAQAIIAYREANNGFARVEDLLLVKGIGAKKYDAIKGMITVGK